MEPESTEEKIHLAALKEFGEHGYEGARIDRIAERGGINKAMIYYHFKNKEALYESIILNLYKKVEINVINELPEDIDPFEQINFLAGNLIDTILSTEPEIVKVMMREIVTGGKYFRKILIPNLIMPFMGKVTEIIKNGEKKGIFGSIDPYYTFIQIVGSIVFFNVIRVVLMGTPPGDFIFTGDYKEKFKKNLFTILEKGIQK